MTTSTSSVLRLSVAAVLIATSGWAGLAHAEQQSEIDALLKPVSAWVDAFNRWDAKYPEDAFTEDAAVIDQFGIFVWSGSGSARTWWRDLVGATDADHERRRPLAQHVEMERPTFVQVKDGKAYFVQRAVYNWTRDGVRHTMHAAWVATETKTADGWRISSHAWAPLSEE